MDDETRCAHCSAGIVNARGGRRRRFCSDACKMAAARRRRLGLAENHRLVVGAGPGHAADSSPGRAGRPAGRRAGFALPDDLLRRLAAGMITPRDPVIPELVATLGLDADEIRQALLAIQDRMASVGFALSIDGDRVRMLPALGDEVLQEYRTARVGLAGGSRQARSRDPDVRLRLSSPVLIGREAELAMLLQQAAARPSVVAVEGDAGIGKSRLVREALSRAEPGTRILTGACHPLRDPPPLGPLIDALGHLGGLPPPRRLSALVGALRPLLPELAEQLPAALPPLRDAHAERHRAQRALFELIQALGPTVCLLEDVHWADRETDEFLRLLVARMPANLALLLTYRPHDVPRASSVVDLIARPQPEVSTARVALGPLTVAEVRHMVRAMLSIEDVSDEFASCLHERTAGVPFAVEEVVRSIADRRELVRRGGNWVRRTLSALEVPPTVRDSILARCSRLSPDAWRITEAAAVLGTPAAGGLLAAVAGLPVTRGVRGLRAALDAAVLHEVGGERCTFRHDLAAQAIYDSLPHVERRRLHRRAAEALEAVQPRPAAALARHFQAAGWHEKWIRSAEIAADEAASRQDHLTAARLLHDALVVPPGAATVEARLGVKLGRAALHAHVYQIEAIALLTRGLERQLSPGVRGHLRSLVGLLMIEIGDASAGHRQLGLSVSELRRRPEVASLVMLNLAVPVVAEGRERDHKAWLERAVATAGGGKAATLVAASIRCLLAVYCGDPGAWAVLRQLPPDPPALAERRQLLWLSTHLAGASVYLGQYRRAREFLDEAERRAHDLGWGRLLPIRDTAILMLDWATGSRGGLEARAGDYADAMAADWPGGALVARMLVGWLRLGAGRIDAGESSLRECCGPARAAGLIPGFAFGAAGLAQVQLDRGNPDAAYEEAAAALAVIEGKEIWPWAAEVAPVAVRALIASGRVDAAAALAERFASGVQGRDAPLASAATQLCGGMVAEAMSHPEDAASAFASARIRYASLPRPDMEALASRNLGLLLLHSDATQATALLREAHAGFEALGATADAARLRRELRGRGITLPVDRRGAHLAGETQLSPREAQVAALAADGMTNAAIAAALFVSTKTVETHLAAVMRKLQVGSRAQLKGRRPAAGEAGGWR